VDVPGSRPTTRKPKIKLKFDSGYPAPNIPASWNVCPTDPMLVAVRSQDGKRIPQQALLVPYRDDALTMWPVNRQRIGNVRNKDREVALPEVLS